MKRYAVLAVNERQFHRWADDMAGTFSQDVPGTFVAWCDATYMYVSNTDQVRGAELHGIIRLRGWDSAAYAVQLEAACLRRIAQSMRGRRQDDPL